MLGSILGLKGKTVNPENIISAIMRLQNVKPVENNPFDYFSVVVVGAGTTSAVLETTLPQGNAIIEEYGFKKVSFSGSAEDIDIDVTVNDVPLIRKMVDGDWIDSANYNDLVKIEKKVPNNARLKIVVSNADVVNDLTLFYRVKGYTFDKELE